MTTMYSKVYKAPIWLNVNADPEYQEPLVKQLVEQGAFVQEWPSLTFYNTVVELAAKGWHHIVDQAFPYVVSVEFLNVAAKAHIAKTLGASKLLGASAKPWSQSLNRRVGRPEDYEDLFDQILGLEDAITLSQLFDLGDRCYNGPQRHKLIVSVGNVPRNVLSDIADYVIVAGKSRADVPQQGTTPEQFTAQVFDALDATLARIDQTTRR